MRIYIDILSTEEFAQSKQVSVSTVRSWVRKDQVGAHGAEFIRFGSGKSAKNAFVCFGRMIKFLNPKGVKNE